jgi:hypothetical protein
MGFDKVIPILSMVIALAGLVIQFSNWEKGQLALALIWLHLIYELRFVWLAVAAYGAWRFGKFLLNLHQASLKTAENVAQLTSAIEGESKNRAAAIGLVVGRITALDNRLSGLLKDQETRTEKHVLALQQRVRALEIKTTPISISPPSVVPDPTPTQGGLLAEAIKDYQKKRS